MSRWISLFVWIVIVGLFCLFIGLRLTVPSDGAHVPPGSPAVVADGVAVVPLVASPGGLRDGDVVTHIEGYSMEAWAYDLLRRELPRPDWEKGGTVAYQVERSGQAIKFDQPLATFPLLELIRREWGSVLFTVTLLVVGLFAFSRKPDDTAVQLLFIASAAALSSLVWSVGMVTTDFVFGLSYAVYQWFTIVAYNLVWASVLHLVVIFPKPQPWLRNHRWFLPLIYLFPLLLSAGWIVASYWTTPSRLAWLGQLGVATFAIPVLYALPIIAAAVLAFRYADDPVSRAQIRWVLFALVVAVTFNLVTAAIPRLVTGEAFLSDNVSAIVWLIFPIGIVVAIFRYQLFSIDIIIRRTTQYAIVTALLALIYFGSVVILQRLFTALTGQTSTLAIVLSTLLIAALFLPLRRRVQEWIDRRFYRSTYDAEKTLEQFAATVRDETDLDELTDELVRVIQETMQPEHITVWLRPVNELAEASSGEAGQFRKE